MRGAPDVLAIGVRATAVGIVVVQCGQTAGEVIRRRPAVAAVIDTSVDVLVVITHAAVNLVTPDVLVEGVSTVTVGIVVVDTGLCPRRICRRGPAVTAGTDHRIDARIIFADSSVTLITPDVFANGVSTVSIHILVEQVALLAGRAMDSFEIIVDADKDHCVVTIVINAVDTAGFVTPDIFTEGVMPGSVLVIIPQRGFFTRGIVERRPAVAAVVDFEIDTNVILSCHRGELIAPDVLTNRVDAAAVGVVVEQPVLGTIDIINGSPAVGTIQKLGI